MTEVGGQELMQSKRSHAYGSVCMLCTFMAWLHIPDLFLFGWCRRSFHQLTFLSRSGEKAPSDQGADHRFSASAWGLITGGMFALIVVVAPSDYRSRNASVCWGTDAES